jgi:uncharacterized protein YqgC (DUF456 family)
MSGLNDARERINELLEDQIPPGVDADLVPFYQQLASEKRNNIEPLLKFIEGALSLIPGFLRDNLLKKAEESDSGKQLPDYTEFCHELARETGKHYFQAEDLSTLIHDACGIHPPAGLVLEELQEVYCRSIYHEKQFDSALDVVYRRMAHVAQMLPNFLVGPIAQLALSPYIGAKVTEYLTDKKASELVKYFRDDFLGELVLHLSSQKTAMVASLMQFRRVAAIMNYMLEREYYPHMAAVLESAPENLIRKLVGELQDLNHRLGVIRFLDNQKNAEFIARLLNEKDRMAVADGLREMQSEHAAAFI